MQAKIKTLTAKNSSNEEYIVYPRTLIKCVTNENGDSLETTLKEFIADNVDEVITEVVEETFDSAIAESIDPVYAKISDVNSTVSDLQTQVDKKVSNTLTVNNKALIDNITLNAEDVGADLAGAASDALTAAKEYTDEEVTKANTYADGVGATTLASAKAYSDTNASTTLTSAKNYAAEEDAKTLATAKSHADTKATNTLTTAKTYSDSNAASALASAKSYTNTSAANTLASAKEYNDAAYANANAYTDQKIADLINGAPTTLDTLKEITDAMTENEEVVDALEDAIGTKANQAELDTHTGNNTIHITANERTAWNNKANSADLANYLPLSGGRIKGDITQSYDDNSNAIRTIGNSLRTIKEIVAYTGEYAIEDVTNGKDIIRSTADGTNTFNGTATNATQLGGKSAGEWQTELDGVGNRINDSVGSYDSFAALYNKGTGIYAVYITGNDKPAENGDYYVIQKYRSETLGTQIAVTHNTYDMYVRSMHDGTWLPWQKLATTADLANYVSVSDYLGGSKVSVGVDKNKNLDVIYFEFSDGTRKLLKYDNTTKRLGFTEFDGSTWSGKDFAYIADLANYLPKSGGTVSGNVTIHSDKAENRLSYLQNSLRSVYQKVDANGLYRLHDNTNGASIITSTKDGTTTFNGTASGNLPLSGNSTVTGTVKFTGNGSNTPIEVNGTYTTNRSAFIRYLYASTQLGYMGFDQDGKPAIINATGQKELLHTGNSAKVATSGSYSDLTDKPTIPTKTSQLTNDSNYITGITKSMVTTALGYTPPTSDTNTTYSAGTGLGLSGTTFSVSYGTTAGTACQGNDSRLSNARPASDVYSWAKASSKPSYTASEVGALSSNGGTLNGQLKWNASSLPQATSGLSFILGIDAFADGGTTRWCEAGSVTVGNAGYATTAGTANAVAWGNVSGKPSSYTPASHNQAASTITAGTFGGAVVAPASTAYTTNQLRNGVFTTTDPGAGASSSYANGSIIYVYE